MRLAARRGLCETIRDVSWLTRNPEKLRRKGAEANIRSYTSLTRNVEQVPDAEWISQFDAAADLGVSLFAVLQFIAARRLVPAEDSRGRGGVTRSSVQQELDWRSQSNVGQRFIRRVKSFL